MILVALKTAAIEKDPENYGGIAVMFSSPFFVENCANKIHRQRGAPLQHSENGSQIN